MKRQSTFAVLFTLWLSLLFLGCGRPQDRRKAEPPTEPRSEPVLKTDDDAKTIIDNAIKAYGGDKAFSRWACGYLKYKAKGSAFPPQLAEATVEDTFQLPGHFKRVARVDTISGKQLVMVFVINHGKVRWFRR